MENEKNLIPYHATDLTGKKALVIAPHPDDESIGCGGCLALHVLAGDPVKVVFLTNGAKGDSSGKMAKRAYVELRQNEAAKACACLGVTDLEFWSYEDRSLAGSRGALLRMIDLLEDYRPDLVYAPSPLEFHPDHRAACSLLCDAIRSCHYDTEVAFYEVGQPLRVNLLVDITRVLSCKVQAMNTYESQLAEMPYGDISEALSRYRSMTLPEGVTHAEGFSLWGTAIIKKIGLFSALFQGLERLLPSSREAGPLVSVIVRTKDRPALLANALRSIAEQTYANIEIVVVNDGGQDVKDVATALASGIPITYIAHQKSEGRAAAANSGLKAARGAYLNFLDDDDVFLPDHVETLISYLAASDDKVAYSNVLNVYFTGSIDSSEHRLKEELIFNFDFDPEMLLFQNYIPIMSVLFSEDIISKVEGFCDEMELFEDWDFWIRVSRYFPFHHIDKITAEYRFYGVIGAEAAHREKYRYDAELAAAFDRALPYLNGKAWVNFLNNGSMGKFRKEALEMGLRLAEMEERELGYRRDILRVQESVESYKMTMLEKEEELKHLKSLYNAQLMGNGRLKRGHMGFQMNPESIQRYSAYKVWKKIVGLIRR